MATRTACWDPKCKGLPFAVPFVDGAARLSEGFFGRIHYQCDTCKARWSVTPEFMLKDMGRIKPRKQSTQSKNFEDVWNCQPKVDTTFRRRGST
jgi:hypothetical protein